jgi:hypothetical protein
MQMSLFMILAMIVVYYFVFCNNKNIEREHLDSTVTATTPAEAIQTLASLYNSNQLTANNIKVLQAMSVGADLTIGGNVTMKNATMDAATIAKDMVVKGNTFIGGNMSIGGDVTAKSLLPSDKGPLIIGNGNNDLLLRRKVYVIPGNTGGGDISNAKNYQDIDHALVACKGLVNCQQVSTNGGTFWLKGSNNYDWLVGSPNWPNDVLFSSNISDNPTKIITAKTLMDCSIQTKMNNLDFFNYAPILNLGNNCRMYNSSGGNGFKTHFVKSN